MGDHTEEQYETDTPGSGDQPQEDPGVDIETDTPPPQDQPEPEPAT